MGAVPVSIVIRSMDRPTLGRAVRSALNQTMPPQEIVVVAACGRDHSPIDFSTPQTTVRLVFGDEGSARLPRPKAGNVGIDAVSQPWINFLDDDDEFLPHHLATLWPPAERSFAASQHAARLVYSVAQGVDASGRKTDCYGRSFSLVKIWENTILHTMNALFHRSLVDEGCRFDETLDVLEDWDFWIQCAMKTGFAFCDTVTSIWHGDEGESGCGFGSNANGDIYSTAQRRVQAKWATERAEIEARIRQARLDAHAAFRAGDVTAAGRLGRSVLLADPENADMANLLGMILLQRGDAESALQLLRVAHAQLPNNPGLCLNLGLAEEQAGRPAMAQQWFARGLAIDPAHPALLRRVGASS
jgi:hypothetical protein